MKTNSFRKVLFASLMLSLVTGCGKDKEKSSAAPAPAPAPVTAPAPAPAPAPVVNNLQSVTGQQAYSNALAWYNSTTENSVPTSAPAITEHRSVSTFGEPNCKSTTVLKFINLSGCFGVSASNSNVETRYVIPVQNGVSKATNSKLAAVFSAPTGYSMISAQQVPGPFNFPIFMIDYGNSSNGHVIRYMIDSGLNSAFNPIRIYDTSIRKSEEVTNPNQLR